MTGDDLRALSAAATPGPWKSYKYGITACNADGEPYEPCGDYQDDMRYEDKELIVWLRNHAAALADLIDAARGLLDEQREGVGHQACEYVTPCPKYHPDDADRWCGWCRLIPALAALEADQ